jgi:hypothetical protein
MPIVTHAHHDNDDNDDNDDRHMMMMMHQECEYHLGLRGRNFVRKTQCSFGWDWGWYRRHHSTSVIDRARGRMLYG